MNIWRILTGRLSLHYLRTRKWFLLDFNKYWQGRLFYLSISKFNIVLDCRIDWIEDMRTGEIK